MEIYLQKACLENCKEIHKMQVLAFKELLDKYKDYDSNPGAETFERIKQKMAQEFTSYYFICLNGCNIGIIRVVELKNDICRISPMFILPEYQGTGYAQQTIQKVELIFPNARSWLLDTIKQEEKLCYLYEKNGYKVTGKEENINEGMTIVYYSKQIE